MTSMQSKKCGEPIDDKPKDWALFELEIDFYSHNLDGLLPEE
jgi:hypothetical protein